MSDPRDCRTALEAVWRLESGRIVAILMRLVRDLALAEELAQDALVIALETWTDSGIPENPAGWLMTTAKNRALDLLRRQARYSDIQQQLVHELSSHTDADAIEEAAEARIDDDVLRLMFIVCHPLLTPEARVALVLRLVNGLSVAEIARGYLVAETTIAQRITRAKRTLKAARVPFELPQGAERTDRLVSVCEAIYLIFNEGYAATAGEGWMRQGLCEEALRLARGLARLIPDDTETLGLAALLEFQSSRLAARVGQDGQAVLLADQDRACWDRLRIRRGLDYLDQAFALERPVGAYCLQAAIAASHARAPSWDDTDWDEVLALYDALFQAQPTAVVALNRAVAVSMAEGPAAGLEIVDALRADKRLANYHLLHSVRADLLQKLGRLTEAREDYLRAAAMTGNGQERLLLERCATECVAVGGQAGNRAH